MTAEAEMRAEVRALDDWTLTDEEERVYDALADSAESGISPERVETLTAALRLLQEEAKRRGLVEEAAPVR